MKTSVSIFITLIIFLSSCNSAFQMEKRHYRNGFYIHHSNSDTKNCAPDSSSKFSAKYPVLKHSDSVPEIATHPVFEKIETVSEKRVVSAKQKINKRIIRKRKENLKQRSQQKNNPDEEDPQNHDVTTSTVFGILAIISIVVGLALIEFAVFGIIPILIGLCFASIGLSFGRRALSYGGKKRKGHFEPADDAVAKRKKAKRAYLLNLSAILILLLYILIRFGIVAAGSVYGIALLLLGICLVLFLLFRMGVFRDLKG